MSPTKWGLARMRMRRWHLVLLLFFTLVGTIVLYWYEWFGYLAHLAHHQSRVLFSRTSLAQLLEQESLQPEKRSKLQLITELRQYARELYALEKSHTFENYVDLGRETIGWNLTATPEFSWEPLKFSFPLVGSFSYLGFFDKERAQQKAEQLIATGHDVYLSEIGGYSTLGWFSDPVFNTYLNLPERSLVRLVLHEISHEKLYFKDDSTFSESLSTFIEHEATRRFYRERRNYQLPEEHWQAALQEYERFWQHVNATRSKLSALYASELPVEQKRLAKQNIYSQLQKRLKAELGTYRFILAPKVLSSYPQLNNAVLIQYQRYTPQKNGFARLLSDCQQNIACWFAQLERLKDCPAGRKLFLANDIPLSRALEECG